MASFYTWAFRWLQSLLALKICSVVQKIHKNCEKNENLPSKSQKMTFWCGRKKWRGRWTVNNSFRSVGLKMWRVKINKCFICIRDVIDKLEIRQAEVNLLVYKSERSSRLAKSEGKKLCEKCRKSNFSE